MTTVVATNPRTGVAGPEFHESSPEEIERALAAAARAAGDVRLANDPRRSALLYDIARRLRSRQVDIVAAAARETGLGEARLSGELERTAVQLELFADVVRAGDYLGVIIDTADPQARPVPRPDLRRMLVPIGPVVVFGASNFPLAFSTAGGDTASALAAGCPVVVKAHPAHPQTGALVAREIEEAIVAFDLPEGTFAHLVSAGVELGELLVDDDRVEAVGFTGSLTAGTAIAARAARRPRPIPVHAEMSSVNPVVVTDGALRERGDALADGLVTSVTGSAGQLCTKPGVVLVPAGDAGQAFAAAVARGLDDHGTEVLLADGIRERLRAAADNVADVDGVRRLTTGDAVPAGGFRTAAQAFQAPLERLLSEPVLREEMFGPAVLLVDYERLSDVEAALAALGGQLTVTLQMADGEGEACAPLIAAAQRRAGRVLFDGFPTGVSVSWAMTHGGPFPATTNAGATSVGMTAIERFLRPVTYQSAPQSLLPPALRDGNPLGLQRRIDGELRRD